MSNDMRKRRRQVAWVCFEPYLSEEELLKSIQILERSFQTDSISNLIAYISRVCADFGIDTQVRKSLYSKFHEMMAEETDLLIDPLSLMRDKEPARSASKLPEYKSAPIQPKPAPAIPLEPKSVPIESTPLDNRREFPPHTTVFINFMQQIIIYLPEKSILFIALIEFSKGKKQDAQEKEIAVLVGRWANNPDNFDWAEGLDEKVLARLVHLVYTGLCELLGPIEADESFHKAMAFCEQQPEARQFSPARFL
jgi:hypothetical protein